MAQLKEPTTYEQQLSILRDRNVLVENESFCLSVLESVNYYRFVAYFLPFKQANGNYSEGTRFLQVLRIYEFDRKLRGILFSALEEVEVFIRAKLAYFHAHKYGGNFGFLLKIKWRRSHLRERPFLFPQYPQQMNVHHAQLLHRQLPHHLHDDLHQLFLPVLHLLVPPFLY